VDALVRDGCATLTGVVDSPRKRFDAELAVRSIPGITMVLNCIEITG
jgi:osmotically-inducible protein OsmY